MSRGEERNAKRRWWQFSLRLLLLLTFVVAAFFGGWQANEFRRRAKSVPMNVTIVPLSRGQQLRRRIADEKLIHEWEMMERQKRQPVSIPKLQRKLSPP
jgi:hypothetical protein